MPEQMEQKEAAPQSTVRKNLNNLVTKNNNEYFIFSSDDRKEHDWDTYIPETPFLEHQLPDQCPSEIYQPMPPTQLQKKKTYISNDEIKQNRYKKIMVKIFLA